MYSVITPQPAGLQPAETAVELADGTRVAVSVRAVREPNNTGLTLTGVARCLDLPGVRASFTHVASAEDVISQGTDAIAKQLILALLGEPTIIPWSADLLSSVSIKNAVALAAATKVDLSKVL